MCPPLKKKKFFFFADKPPAEAKSEGSRAIGASEKKKNFVPSYPGGQTLDPSTEWGPLLDLRPPHRYSAVQVALPPTVRSSLPLGEEPYAGSRADLLGSPISASYWTKTITTALVEVLH